VFAHDRDCLRRRFRRLDLGFGSELCLENLIPGDRYNIHFGSHAPEQFGLVQLDIESPCPSHSRPPPAVPTWEAPSGHADAKRVSSLAGPKGPTARELIPKMPIQAEVGFEVAGERIDAESVPIYQGGAPECGPWVYNGFESVQVNADSYGCDLFGDAPGNCPTIAVDPTNRDRIVVAWRHFTDPRRAAWAYTHDAGRTWTYAGTFDNGAWLSLPIVVADHLGDFHCHCVDQQLYGTLLTSFDGGISWPRKSDSLYGDLPWVTTDLPNGIGKGNIYQMAIFDQFARFVDGGASMRDYRRLPESMRQGTMTIGINGDVFVVGSGLVTRSISAKDGSLDLLFTPAALAPMELGYAQTANSGGLVGRAWIVSDNSGEAHQGTIYLLSPGGPANGVSFSKSTDNRQTWSIPRRLDVNGCSYCAWFGMMSIAPRGRIVVAGNDLATGCTDPRYCFAMYFVSSEDGGATWTSPIQVTPSFDNRLGNLGHYNQMVSDDAGANIAYAARFT